MSESRIISLEEKEGIEPIKLSSSFFVTVAENVLKTNRLQALLTSNNFTTSPIPLKEITLEGIQRSQSSLKEHSMNSVSKGNNRLSELKNNTKQALELIREGADPNCRDEVGKTLLQRLLAMTQIDFALSYAFELIRYGADPTTKDKDGNTLIHHLISLTIDPHVDHDCYKKIEILVKAFNEKKPALKLLEIKNAKAHTPIMIAIYKLHPVECINTLLQLGNVSSFPEGNTLLHIAAYAGNKAYAGSVLETSPKFLNATNDKGLTPFYCAIEEGKFELALWLVEKKEANVLCGLLAHKTLWAAIPRNQQMVIWLIKAISDKLMIAKEDSKKITEWQLTPEYIGSCKLILKQIESILYRENTPLHIAACAGNIAEAENVLKTSPQLLNATNENHCTALYYAIEADKFEFARWLVEKKGANVLCGLLSHKILWVTIAENQQRVAWLIKAITEKLLMVSQDNKKSDEWQLTPSYIAGCKLMLKQIEKIFYLKSSLLHIAASEGDIDYAEDILKISPHLIDKVNDRGITPLYYAIERNNFEFARWLVEKQGANVLCGLLVHRTLWAALPENQKMATWLIKAISAKLVFAKKNKLRMAEWKLTSDYVACCELVLEQLKTICSITNKRNSLLREKITSSFLKNLNLIDEIEALKVDDLFRSSSSHRAFCSALEELLLQLDKELVVSNQHNKAAFSDMPAAMIATKTLNLLLSLKTAKTQQEKLKMICEYENACKVIPGWMLFFKALAMVCFAAVGFVLGVVVGMAFGAAAGLWTGPGAFVTAALGVASGAVVGLFATANFLNLASGMTSGLLLFNSNTLQRSKKLATVIENAKTLCAQKTTQGELSNKSLDSEGRPSVTQIV